LRLLSAILATENSSGFLTRDREEVRRAAEVAALPVLTSDQAKTVRALMAERETREATLLSYSRPKAWKQSAASKGRCGLSSSARKKKPHQRDRRASTKSAGRQNFRPRL